MSGRPWVTIERTELLDALASVVGAEPSRRGVILTGEAGIGKSTLAIQLAARIAASTLHVRGSDVMSPVPYGALSTVLNASRTPVASAEVGDGGFDLAHRVNAALVDVVDSRSEDGTLAVVVDNAQLLDDASAHALGQLADRNILIVAAPGLGDLPEPLLELWRDGVLAARAVDPLAREDVAELLTRHLGGPVAAPAIDALCSVSGRNPLYLHHLVDEHLAAGSLVQHDGVWALASGGSLADERLVDILRHRIDRWNDGERRVLELVSLADSLPFSLLERFVELDDIATLLDENVIEVSAGARPAVRVRHQLVADVVRSGVSFVRRRQLHAQVIEADVDGSLAATDEGVLALAAWTLSAGVPLDPLLAVRAATAANQLYDPEFALRLATAVEDDELLPAASIQKSRAWRMLGQSAHAATVLARVDAAPEPLSLEPSAAVALAAEWVAVVRHDPAREDDARRALQRAATTAASEQSLHARFDVARWELAVALGEYVELLPELEALLAGPADPGERRVAAMCVLAEAYAVVGRHEDALQLLEQARPVVTAPALSGTTADLVLSSYLCALSRLGRFELDEALRSETRTGAEHVYYGSMLDSAAGSMLLLAGRAQEAVEHLQGALAQLRVRDVRPIRGQVLACLAYATALLDQPDATRTYLAEYGEGVPGAWHTVASSTRFALGARGLVEDRGPAIDGLLHLAERHIDAGLPTEALLGLRAAARLGSDEAIERMLACELPQPGPWARAMVDWARARASDDPALLSTAATELLAVGDLLLAHDAATRALELDPALREAIDVRAETARGLGIVEHAQSTVLDVLTRRERDVAERAAVGTTNRDIAAELYLSIRTVESYLQSAYGKLGVRTRTELAALVQ